MVLQAGYVLASSILPPKYWPYAVAVGVVTVIVYAYAQGRSTTRERDLHGRVVLLTGPFTPIGLGLLTALAQRGAHVITVSPYPLSHPFPSVIVPLLRSTLKNENIFAEYADFSSPESIRAFCTSFLTNNDSRLDAIVFAHEYPSIGRMFGGRSKKAAAQFAKERESASLASFLITTLLLPLLLVAPVERDIRIVSVVNPFYSAASPLFWTTPSPQAPRPLLLDEGHRSLRTAIFTRHLQRILDSLPNRAVDPAAKPGGPPPAPVPSNILAVSACPGISRRDTVAPLLGAHEFGWSLPYILLLLPLLLFTKAPASALQTVLHVLFLPTPLKRAQAAVDAAADEESKAREAKRVERRGNVEVLKAGGLYRECAVVRVNVPPPPPPPVEEQGKEKTEEKAQVEDDGELGGEASGRVVWEWYEARLKAWEAEEKKREEGRPKPASAEKGKEKAAPEEEEEDDRLGRKVRFKTTVEVAEDEGDKRATT